MHQDVSESEKNYALIELELLPIVFAMTRFDQYAFGIPNITIHTDHEPLIPIFRKSLLQARKRLQSNDASPSAIPCQG